jgi:hypothetical protein
MVEGKDDKAVRGVKSERGFGSRRIVMGEDHLLYLSDTEKEKGH